jgi:hypothetical protein
MFAIGLYLQARQPPCPGGFIDGPCDPGYDAFGAWIWLLWLGGLGFAGEIVAMCALGVWRYVRR